MESSAELLYYLFFILELLNYNIYRVKYVLTHYRKVKDLMNGVVQESE